MSEAFISGPESGTGDAGALNKRAIHPEFPSCVSPNTETYGDNGLLSLDHFQRVES